MLHRPPKQSLTFVRITNLEELLLRTVLALPTNNYHYHHVVFFAHRKSFKPNVNTERKARKLQQIYRLNWIETTQKATYGKQMLKNILYTAGYSYLIATLQ